jgi:hypothetical protein
MADGPRPRAQGLRGIGTLSPTAEGHYSGSTPVRLRLETVRRLCLACGVRVIRTLFRIAQVNKSTPIRIPLERVINGR